MACARRRGKNLLISFPGEQCGSEGVTASRCPAWCQEPQGFERKPSRWLPSAPGTSCHCRSPKAHECTEKTNRSQPFSPRWPAGCRPTLVDSEWEGGICRQLGHGWAARNDGKLCSGQGAEGLGGV